jgi:diguanylate cyclase (GGDEF)-like protein/PAS domain S-box-containing protein
MHTQGVNMQMGHDTGSSAGQGRPSTSERAAAAPLRLAWAVSALALTLLAAAVVLLGAGVAKHGVQAEILVATVLVIAAALGLAGYVVHTVRVMRAQALAMAGAHDGLWEWNPVTKELRVGKRLLAILGYDADFLFDTHSWLELVHPDDRAGYNHAVAQHLKGHTDHFYFEYRVRAMSGEYRWIASRGLALRNRHGVSTLMAGSVSDITDSKAREQQVRELALVDQLTGLPNRRSLEHRLVSLLAESDRLERRVGVLFVDVDRFKDVNDSLGHSVGDQLLLELAQRLPRVLRSYDEVFRQGGDELIVLLPDLQLADEAALAAARLREAIAQPLTTQAADLFVTASIGIAIFPEDGRDADMLLRNADMAMYDAKAAGGNVARFFEDRMNERLRRRVSMESRLRRAVENGDFALHYQPQVECVGGRLVGAEALLRWYDGERSVPPDQFIPLAEETGLIEPLGEWVLDTAIRQASRWWRSYESAPRVGINLSARQFWRHSLHAGLLDRVLRFVVPSRLVELEITESVLLHPESGAIDDLRKLRENGFRVSLDDFGTGYSSLSYLRLLQLDSLKIDKSFIADMCDPEGRRGTQGGLAILHAIVAMARELSLEVVAEGVETAVQRELLADMGCDLMQGYLVSRPVPADEFEQRFLRAQLVAV